MLYLSVNSEWQQTDLAHEAGELRAGIDPGSGAVIFLGALESALASFVLPVHGAVHENRPNVERARESLHTILLDGLLA